MNMTSNCDVTKTAHHKQMTTICYGTKPPHENFLRTPLSSPIYQNESKNFSKLFLLKWLFLWLQMLSVPLNNGVKPYTKPTLPVGWHWSITLLAVQAYRTIGAFKHTKCTISPQERGFPTLWRHTEKYQFYWN